MDAEKLFRWVETHKNDAPASLRLKYTGKDATEGVDIPLAVLQIESRARHARKLGKLWEKFPHFLFPTSLSGEQATSPALAEFHVGLIPAGARSIADLTAGLGVDAMTMCEHGLHVTAVEMNSAVASALEYNAEGLGLTKLKVVEGDCREWLDEAVRDGLKYDVAFIDPARRDKDGGRLFALEACSPDVVALLPQIQKVCRRLIIKASPMLDIAHTIAELTPPGVAEAIATGTPTECKELLAVVDFEAVNAEPRIRAVTVNPADGKVIADYSFTRTMEKDAPAIARGSGVKVGDILLEPYPATMKTGVHRSLAETFNLRGFDNNTHIYYSSAAPVSFPGEKFRVEEVLPYASRVIKRFAAKYPAISITARNFGVETAALKKKLGVKDGDSKLRLFALTGRNGEKLLIVASKMG